MIICKCLSLWCPCRESVAWPWRQLHSCFYILVRSNVFTTTYSEYRLRWGNIIFSVKPFQTKSWHSCGDWTESLKIHTQCPEILLLPKHCAFGEIRKDLSSKRCVFRKIWWIMSKYSNVALQFSLHISDSCSLDCELLPSCQMLVFYSTHSELRSPHHHILDDMYGHQLTILRNVLTSKIQVLLVLALQLCEEGRHRLLRLHQQMLQIQQHWLIIGLVDERRRYPRLSWSSCTPDTVHWKIPDN